jgi:hypothetical protein
VPWLIRESGFRLWRARLLGTWARAPNWPSGPEGLFVPSLASFWILALFQPVISDACHALIVILDTIRSYGCNDRLEWAASSRQRDQQLKAIVISRVLDPGLPLCQE